MTSFIVTLTTTGVVKANNDNELAQEYADRVEIALANAGIHFAVKVENCEHAPDLD